MTLWAPIVTSGSPANGFNSSQDMQSSRADARPRRRRDARTARSISRRTSCLARQARAASRADGRRRPAWRPASRCRAGWRRRRSPPRSRIGRGDHPLQRDPPQPARAFGEFAGDIDRERRVEFAHHRQREIAIVAIAVVEGEAGEAPREIALGQPPLRFVQGDDDRCPARADAPASRAGIPASTSRWRLGWNSASRRGPDVVQHENGADAGEDRTQQRDARR